MHQPADLVGGREGSGLPPLVWGTAAWGESTMGHDITPSTCHCSSICCGSFPQGQGEQLVIHTPAPWRRGDRRETQRWGKKGTFLFDGIVREMERIDGMELR